jgi:integrase/recombinase XerD
MTIPELTEKFLEYSRLIKKAEGTISYRKYHLKKFYDFLLTCSVMDINDIRRQHVIEFQKETSQCLNQYGKQDSPDMLNRYLASVKMFFKFLKREGIIIHDPTDEVEYMKVPKRLPLEALSYKEIKKILNTPDTSSLMGYRDRTMLEVFYSSGIRRGELRTLKLKDTDFEGGYLRVIGKGDKERVVPLGKEPCRYVENYIKGIRPYLLNGKESEYLFFGRGGRLMTDQLLQLMIRRCLKKAKIKKPVTFHTFRRSCATGMIRNNANVMHVKALLGHDSMDAINRYVDLTIVDLKKEHKKCHPREKNQ